MSREKICKECSHIEVCVLARSGGWSSCPFYKKETDVVPKSEVENLKVLLVMNEKAYKSLKELYHTDTDALVEARRKTEVEVAREIFEDIDNALIENFHADCQMGDCIEDYYDDNLRDDIFKIKKKYTEEKKDDNQN
jgi:hypothetical protein